MIGSLYFHFPPSESACPSLSDDDVLMKAMDGVLAVLLVGVLVCVCNT